MNKVFLMGNLMKDPEIRYTQSGKAYYNSLSSDEIEVKPTTEKKSSRSSRCGVNGWGGKREGAGRKIGWRKENSEIRPTHTIRAFDDEWNLINAFAKIVKHGDKDKCKKILEQFS